MTTLTKTQAAQRLRKLEAEILPLPRAMCRILHLPSAEAEAALWDLYSVDLARARQAGEKVCVVTDQPVHDLEHADGVVYAKQLWQAQLMLLESTPSQIGLPSMLHDLFAMLRRSANVVGPDPRAALPDDEDDDSDGPVVPCARLYEAQPQVTRGRRWSTD